MKVFLFLPLPAATLTAGYDRIAILRSKNGPTGTYREVTHTREEIVIESIRHNYAYIVDAKPSHYFKPVLRDSTGTLPDVVQEPRQAASIDFESVLTVDELKRIFLFGVDLTNDIGSPYPDEMFVAYIRTGISQIEHELDVSLIPRVVVDEGYDYWQRDFDRYAFVQLQNRPVLSVERFAIAFPGATTPYEFPISWVRLQPWAGQLTILPSAGSFSGAMFTAPGASGLLAGAPFIPDIIRIDYTHGFALGQIPDAVKEVVGKKAAFGPLNIAGDLVAGAGIQSKSLSIDGLSSSVTTSNSSTNAGYGARLIQYEKENKAALKTLKSYYKGGRMTVV